MSTTKLEKVQASIAALQAQAAFLKRVADTSEKLSGATEQEKDLGLLRAVGSAMEDRLRESRATGRGGWYDPSVSVDKLSAALTKNLEAGDYLDVALYASMIFVRQALDAALEE